MEKSMPVHGVCLTRDANPRLGLWSAKGSYTNSKRKRKRKRGANEPRVMRNGIWLSIRYAAWPVDDRARDDLRRPGGEAKGVWIEVGHTTRAVLNAVCKVSSITGVRMQVYSRWIEVGRSNVSIHYFRTLNVLRSKRL
jgi:hypothetical protein